MNVKPKVIKTVYFAISLSISAIVAFSVLEYYQDRSMPDWVAITLPLLPFIFCWYTFSQMAQAYHADNEDKKKAQSRKID